MNVQYLKLGEEKIYLEGIDPEENKLELSFAAGNKSLEDIKEILVGLNRLVIYTAIVQEDGRETDEIIHMVFETFTKLSKIEYDLDSKTYKVVLVEPNILEERIAELEDAVNFMLMGGEE